MNQEPLKFIAEDGGYPSGDCGMFAADITVVGEEVWFGRIQVYAWSAEAAEQLRERVLWGLNQPTVPAQFQYLHKGKVAGYNDKGEGTYKDVWVNLDNGGEAARLKGEGYEIRALYAKQPLVQP